jgi:hypothetical protein
MNKSTISKVIQFSFTFNFIWFQYQLIQEKEILDKSPFSNVTTKNASLLFSIEQWELTRRLKNSGLTKEQLCQAFDDLDKMEKDLGNLYNIPSNPSQSQNNNNNNQSSLNLQNFQSLLSKDKSPQQNAMSNASNNFTSITNDIPSGSSSASGIVNSYFAKVTDPEIENREIENYRR